MSLLQPLQHKSIFLTTAVAFVILLSSCANRIVFAPSLVAPSAKGTIRLNKDQNNNFILDVSVKHLPQPQELQPAKAIYVVWMDTQFNGIQNMGQLRIDGSGRGALQTSTPYRPFRVYITAESNADIPYPGSQLIISTRNF